RTPRPTLASLHRGIGRGPPDLVPDPRHDRTVPLRLRADTLPLGIGAEGRPGPLAVAEVIESDDVVQHVRRADHGLPEPDDIDAVLREEPERVGPEAGVHGRHAARDDLVAAHLVDHRSDSFSVCGASMTA